MKQLRGLADLGATVVVLHNTGKSENARTFRGSSDIKAAVDVAYLVASGGNDNASLDKLTLTCFKNRIAPGRGISVQYRSGEGFSPCDSTDPSESAHVAVQEFLRQQPEANQQAVIKALEDRFTKRQITGALEKGVKSGGTTERKGKGKEKLYSLCADQPPDEKTEASKAKSPKTPP